MAVQAGAAFQKRAWGPHGQHSSVPGAMQATTNWEVLVQGSRGFIWNPVPIGAQKQLELCSG